MKITLTLVIAIVFVSCQKINTPKIIGEFKEIYSTYTAKQNQFNYENISYEDLFFKSEKKFDEAKAILIRQNKFIFRNSIIYYSDKDSVCFKKHIFKHNSFNNICFIIEFSKILSDTASIGFFLYIDYRDFLSSDYSRCKYLAWKNNFYKNKSYRSRNYFWGIQNGIFKKYIIGEFVDTTRYQKKYNIGFSTNLLITNIHQNGIFELAPLYNGTTIRDNRIISIDYHNEITTSEFYEDIIKANFPELLN